MNIKYISEKELLQHIPFNLQCYDTDAKLIKKMYESKLKKYYDPVAPVSISNSTCEHNY